MIQREREESVWSEYRRDYDFGGRGCDFFFFLASVIKCFLPLYFISSSPSAGFLLFLFSALLMLLLHLFVFIFSLFFRSTLKEEMISKCHGSIIALYISVFIAISSQEGAWRLKIKVQLAFIKLWFNFERYEISQKRDVGAFYLRFPHTLPEPQATSGASPRPLFTFLEPRDCKVTWELQATSTETLLRDFFFYFDHVWVRQCVNV